MFDRFIRLARANKALKDERFEDALQLASDALIAGDRRAEVVRQAAAGRIVARAEARLAAGDRAAAKVDIDRLRAFPGCAEITVLQAELERAAIGADAKQELEQRDLAAVRRLLEAGETVAAEARLRALAVATGSLEHRHLSAMLAERRRRGAGLAQQARGCLDAGEVEAALEHWRGAETLDRDGAPTVAVRTRLMAHVAQAMGKQCRELVRAGDVLGAVRRYAKGMAQWSWESGCEALQELESELVESAGSSLRKGRSLTSARSLASALQATRLRLPESMANLVAALVSGASEVADLTTPEVEAIVAAGGAMGSPGLVAAAEQLLAAASMRENRLIAARTRIDSGDLDGARALLTEFLIEWPLHEAAQKELEIVDRGVADLDQRLASARSALRAGQLRQACSAASALCGSLRAANEAKQLLAEARARMALVDRGLDEVRVALHGRVAATQEGLGHCLKRLEELAKVQVDHEELQRVIAAVQVEVDALATLEQVSTALERRDRHAAHEGLQKVLQLRSGLLAADRMDARFCERGDRLARLVDAALVAGRLAEVEHSAAQFEHFEPVRKDFVDRAAAWRRTGAERRQAATRLVAEARACLLAKDLAEAERLVEQAQQHWVESSEVRSLAADLERLRHQTDVLERVADLTSERDFLGAGKKLANMPSPSPYLRTRIYDMKQDLARAQGLEGAFLLRVDEGGEHLVLRGETVTLGNVRQARADVPILAQLAGRHASIRRSMSFHGGMQDTIVAEEGEVFVDGRQQTKHVLVAGNRVHLGPALSFVYQRPTSRSLTAAVLLQSGFQVASTDRLLLMKDRGRDGRILLGAGKDVHVRVSRATGEVEIFATNDGQIRVQCADGGTIDGVAFRGEHPVSAGQMVVAQGLTFHLMPWRPA